MSDGTIKQINPFSGTEVWSVPGRGNRPLTKASRTPSPIDTDGPENYCAFCEARQLATPPEKSRMVRSGNSWVQLSGLTPEEMANTRAEFRRVPNLFEIVSYAYWQANHGYRMDEATRLRMESYLAAEVGREHVDAIVDTRLRAAGRDPEHIDDAERTQLRESYFAGGHDVLISRRHFIDGATHDDQLASSGTLSIDEHRAFIRLAVDSTEDLYARNHYARYVSVFQNWLSPAGASFDHLHKQLVAIDSRGVQANEEIARLRLNQNMYNEWGVNFAGYHNLIIAENDHAVLLVGIGHRYPTVSIYSTSANCRPWEHTPEEVDAMSDLIHAAHAATGPEVPCNEEWHHQPPDLDLPMPWRVNIKWRVSTLAGFEGGTKIYVNTLSPTDIRDRVVSSLYALRDEGVISRDIRIATECSTRPNRLLYNPNLS
ncbi:DUF4921 domain-containing protein [Corynebacterium yudongzhengii]|uniref:DUF4921 domain-containing protein n=2 Tax=Corynebacterium yudongzhengii TaxID=2080740 RepID=A0A2U1T6L5_9CORY|nr:DUF4921 domain-containing protein [Corynebacterium yudongzhengii]PWC01632.1 DUF4921 domain-containing protein [Corynebacterium yudongzhengii]